jgi:hypothetical protein
MSNHSALADRYALIKSEIEALNKELEKVRFQRRRDLRGEPWHAAHLK